MNNSNKIIVATWNVNSLKSRMDIVTQWLSDNPIDFLLLQEIKGLDEDIFDIFKNMGYKCYYNLQKTYNGVAIITKHDSIVKHTALPNFDDEQARYLELEYNNFSIINVYVPNGNPVGDNHENEKYVYKINWLNAFYNHLRNLSNNYKNFIIGGDFNIAPNDWDVYDINQFKNDALVTNEIRQIYFKIINLGITNALDYEFGNTKHIFTWWDYRNFGFIKNHGAKIDHILLSPLFADKLLSTQIDKKPRHMDKPSDHTPVVCVFE